MIRLVSNLINLYILMWTRFMLDLAQFIEIDF